MIDPSIYRKALLPSIALMRMLIAFLAVMLTVWLEFFPGLSDTYFANEWLRDHFVRLHATTAPEPRLSLVDIDEASLAAIGPWPWPRTRLAEMLEKLLGEYGAKGVALDMVLPEPADREGDVRLAKLSQYGPVVLAQAMDYGASSLPLRVGAIAGGSPARTGENIPEASGFIGNHRGLGLARHTGNIGFIPDQDGKLRRLPLWTNFEGSAYPSLSLSLMACCHPGVDANPAKSGLQRVSFDRQLSAYNVVRASDVLNSTIPPTLLNGRLILIGASALGLGDRVATPLSPSTSGVMVHAALLSALLDEQAGLAPTTWPGLWIAISFSVFVALVVIYTLPRLSAVTNMLILAGGSLAWLGLAYWISPHDPEYSTTAPLATSLFLMAVAVPFDWQITQRKSRQLLNTLRHYVASVVVDELLRSDLKDPLAPRQSNVTTLIADMEGYTGQVESLSMEEAAQLTRDFLDCLTRPVLENRGTLDKYTGDGLVAFWGAPLPIQDHADLALDAARQIVEGVARLSQSRQQRGMPPLRVRIGIESGIAMAGDFGTSFRSIYTAVGDSVNVASRLEDFARKQPYDIIVGAGTIDMAKRHRFKLIGEVLLRGKGKPTTVFTLEN